MPVPIAGEPAYGQFAYGQSIVTLDVPQGISLAARTPPCMDALALYRKAVAEAEWPERLPAPVAVIVPDETRPAHRAAALEALQSILPSDTLVVVGGGLHPSRPLNTPWPVTVHDAEAKDLVDLGTAQDIAVRLHPSVARAGTVIVVSAVMPHYLAGFSGGPKGIVPGVAGKETILGVHASEPGESFANAIRACAARLPCPAYGLQLLVGARGPFDAVAGPLRVAHDEAVHRYRAACAQPRPAPVDCVIADAGGAPFDATLLQAHKAYHAAAQLVRDGGTLVLLARCDEGYGHPEFEARLRAADPMAGPFHPYARTARVWWEKARRIRTLIVTDLDVAHLGVTRVVPDDVPGLLFPASPPGALPSGASDSSLLLAPAAQELLFS